MATDVISSTHTQTTKMDIHAVAKVLVDELGPTLVAVLAGVKDRKLPTKWAQPDGPMPREASHRRLQAAHRAWNAIAEQEGAYVARTWFIGLNPLLEETPPAVALGQGREREVLEAARAFLEDGQFS